MSIDIEELGKVLYDNSGPTKIGRELEVQDINGNVSPTAHTDLYEFLLSLMLIGIFKFNLIPNANNIHSIKHKLQHYFKRININVDMEICLDYEIDSLCNIYFDINDHELHIIKTIITQLPKKLDDVTGIYILNGTEQYMSQENVPVELHENKKRKNNNISVIKINFSFAF